VKGVAARSSGARLHDQLVAEVPRSAAVIAVVEKASAGRTSASRCSVGVEGSCRHWRGSAELGEEGRIAMGP